MHFNHSELFEKHVIIFCKFDYNQIKNNIMRKLIFLTGILFLICLFPTNSLAQFEQKLTINGSLSFVYPDFDETISNFSSGFGIDGGLQYNLNRHISIIGNARFYYIWGSETYPDDYYDNIAIGGGAKINILPRFIVNPFIFGEASVNMMWIEESRRNSDFVNQDFGTSIGALGGGGLDFILSENFAVYVQSGVYYTYWDDRLNLYSQAGVRINLIKSKTL